MKLLTAIKQNFLSLLRSKSGKTSVCSACEGLEYVSEAEMRQRKLDSDIEDIVLDAVLLPFNIVYVAGQLVYYAGKGIYNGAKKMSESYQKSAR